MQKQKIQDDLKTAMLAKDEERLSVVRMLKSAIQYFEIQKGGAGYEASDEDVMDVVGREIKKRRESIEMYTNGNRPELAAKEERELAILQTYLPEQLDEETVRTLVTETVSQTGATTMQDMGKVMAALMPKVKGKADGNLISTLVRQALG